MQIRLPSSPLHWLVVAGVFHVALTFLIALIGRHQLLPSVFDGDGMGISFAIDGAIYRHVATRMAEALRSGGWSAWVEIQSPFHVRLYSLAFAFLGRAVGYNVLAAEPLNLFYYLATLSLVYLLGQEVFSRQSGMVAAVTVALWPSLLLYSTQLIRDPLSNGALLALLLLMTLLLRKSSWKSCLFILAGSVVSITLFWVSRGNMWSIVIALFLVTALLLSLRIWLLRRFLAPNIAALVLIVIAAVIIPTRFSSATVEGVRPPIAALAVQPQGTTVGPWERFIQQIGHRRAAFRNAYEASGSNIDAEVALLDGRDILKYLPRAAEIGFFAPFPEMWFQAGAQVGRAGRIVSAVETFAMYLLYVAAGVCLWKQRRRLSMWLIFLVASIGLVGLGMIVANVGALYRLRYAFWIMIMLIAAEGILTLVSNSHLHSGVNTSE